VFLVENHDSDATRLLLWMWFLLPVPSALFLWLWGIARGPVRGISANNCDLSFHTCANCHRALAGLVARRG
jgi:hypothetical protein